MKQKYSLCAVIMLMTMMFALVPLRAQNTPPSCRVTITMQDQYGDGWNNAVLSVYQYDALVANISLGSGSAGVDTMHLAADSVRLVWTKGYYDDECSFTITDDDDNVLYAINAGDLGYSYSDQGQTMELGSFVSNCPSCLKPTGLRLAAATASGLDVVWNQRDSVQWQTLWGPHGFEPTVDAATVQSGNTLSLSNLSANTPYDVYLRAVCGEGDTSRHIMRSFLTPDTAAGCTWYFVLRDQNNNAFGGWKILLCHESGVAMDTIAFPDLPTNYQLHYQEVTHSPQKMYLKVLQGNTNLWYGALDLTILDADGDTVLWRNFSEVDLSSEFFDSIYFHCPTCLAPMPVAEALDSTTVRLSWNSTGAVQYLIEYGQQGYGDNSATRVATTDNFLVINNLVNGTIYEAHVGGLCEGEDTSVFREIMFTPARGLMDRIYVNQSKSDTIDGRSWATAFHSVSEAQQCADEQGRLYNNHPDIWVAEGTYYDNYTVYPSQHLYGGFVGNEPANYDISQRDWQAHYSILDGSWNGACLVQNEPFTAATASSFDGFLIGGGQSQESTAGVSLMAYTTLRNCVIENSRVNSSMSGHALLSVVGDPDNVMTVVENCIFQYGVSYQSVIYLENARMDNSLIYFNTTASAVVELGNGGALRHCDVISNYLFDYGDINAVKLSAADATVVNSIVAQNELRNTGTGETGYMTSNLVNTFNGVSYTALNGAVSGTGNISVDTLNAGNDAMHNYLNFVNVDNSDFRLNLGSACIDAATSIAGFSATDIAGNARLYGDAPDMGCYENDGSLICLTPSNFMVQATVEPGTVHTSWTAALVDSYELSYRTLDSEDWTTISDIHTSEYQVSGLPEYTNYLIRVRAICGGMPTNYSDTLQFNSGCRYPIEPLTLGDQNTSSWSQVPINMRYLVSASYMLIKAEEMGGMARSIDTIGFYYISGTQETRHWMLALMPTQWDNITVDSLTSMENGEVYELFDGTVTLYSYGLVKIPLQTSYNYDGHSNLLLVMMDSSDYTASGYRYFRTQQMDFNTLYFYGSDYSNIYGPYTTTNRPSIYLNGDCDLSSCPRPRMLMVYTGEDTVAIELSRLNGTPVLEISGDGGATYHPLAGIEDTTTRYNLVGLQGSHTYQLRLHCLCSEEDSSEYTYLSFTTAPIRYQHIYVKADATGEGNGATWEDAFTDINPAVEMAAATYETYGYFPDIRVAAGTYYGDTTGAENAYYIGYPVNIYGGFAGNEPDSFDLSQRNFVQNATILDGQHQRRVVVLSHRDNAWSDSIAAFDGFTLRNGMNYQGAGIYVNYQVLIDNCRIENCYGNPNNSYTYGAGVYFNSNGSTMKNTVIDSCTSYIGAALYSSENRFYNCDFIHCGYPSEWNNNRVTYNGVVHSIRDTIVGCRIMHDTATYGSLNGESSYLENCLFYDNHSYYSSPLSMNNATYVGCDVVMNTARQGNVIFIGSGRLTNTIVWGNRSRTGTAQQVDYATATWCAIEGGYEGEGNISLHAENAGSNAAYNYPYFVSPEDADFRLMGESSCIDAANDTASRSMVDIAGSPRVYGEHQDIGCYENQGETFCVPPYSLNVTAAGTGAYIEWGMTANTTEAQLEYRAEGANEWTVVEDLVATSLMLENLQPQTTYQVRMKSVCEDNLSSYSAVKTFMTECSEGSSVEAVGDTSVKSNTTSNLPTYIRYSYYAFSQQLFLKDELGNGGIIDTLRFQLASGLDANRWLKIYMGTTSRSSYSNGNEAILLGEQELVYDSLVNFTGEDGWLTIPLQEAYDYNGSDNLVLSVVDSSPSYYYYNTPSFYVEYTNDNKSLYTNGYSQITVSNEYYFNINSYRNVVLFSKTCGNTGCARPLLSVSDVNDSSAVVVCQTNAGQAVELQYKAEGDQEYTSMQLQQRQTLAGLRQNTAYTVRTRSICGEGDTSRWRTVKFTTLPRQQSRYYVAANGTGNGTSWEDAAGSIAWALDAAAASSSFYRQPVEVWVAQGTYYGGFTAFEGINVYGGFAGNEAADYDLSQRDFVQHATILDGKDSMRVLMQASSEFNTATLWDGFTLRNGNVQGTNNTNGGGVYMGSGLRINHFTVENSKASSGGGIYANHGAVIENTVVSHCQADYYGGGIYSNGIRMENTEASYNKTLYSGALGSGLYSQNDTVLRCLFVGDSGYMAAVYGNYSYFESCMVWNNTTTTSGAVSTYRSTFIGCDIVNNTTTGSTEVVGIGKNGTYDNYNTIVNSIIWGNRSLTSPTAAQADLDSMRYCAVEGGYAGSNNIDLASENDGSNDLLVYPLFASPVDGDFRLMEDSPCIDAGTDDVVMRSSKDAAGNIRIYGGRTDMGCLENDGTLICVYPFSLSAQTSSTAAVISWGTPRGAINVQLDYRADDTDEWTSVANLTGSSYMIEGLQPQTLYYYRMKAYCDEEAVSSFTAVQQFMTECSEGGNPVVIGDSAAHSNTNSSLPLNSYYKYSFSQQIFLQGEMGDGGLIDTIRFQQSSTMDDNRNVKIYLGHTALSYFSSGSGTVILPSEMSLVFDGTIALNQPVDGWLTIPLQNPFDYNGSNNLVLTVLDSTGSYTSSSNYYVTDESVSRTLYNYTDGQIIQLSKNNSYNTSSSRNVVVFNKHCGNTGCSRPLLVVDNVTDSSATVLCQTGAASQVELQYKEAGDAEYTSLPLLTNQLLANLRQNTTYTVRTRAICGAGDTSLWRSVSFTTLPKRLSRYYVTSQGTGDGSSWSNASSDLNWVLATAEANYNIYHTPLEVWVAEGTYYGGFTVKEYVDVYGGFAGNEPENYNPDQRNVTAHATILDGQNERTVITQSAAFTHGTALWDGFTVRNGRSTGNGGGILMRDGMKVNNFKVMNCVAQTGGGIYACANNVSASITNTIVTGDSATSNGGGIYATRTDMDNVLVSNNASRGSGGGIYLQSNCNLRNVTVVNNYAYTTSSNQGGIYISSTYSNYIYNSILWGNRNNYGPDQTNTGAYYYNCAIEGLATANTAGNYLLNAENEGVFGPKFVAPTEGAGCAYSGGDWHLQQGSFCINRGNAGTVNEVADLDGNTRVQQDTVDMGCYETSYEGIPMPQYGTIIYVKAQATGTGDGTSWDNAMDDINMAQRVAAMTNIRTVWVAEGIYYGSPDANQGVFKVVPSVNVYGGFEGNEAEDYDLLLRDLENHATILDGGNMYRVLYQASDITNTNQYVEWNGFTLRNGNATNASNGTNGGGAYLRRGIRLVNCVVSGNTAVSGGGVYIAGSYSSETISGKKYYIFYSRLENCKIVDNNATSYGGGVYLSSALVSNCLVANNTSYYSGGGIYTTSYGHVVNATIVANTSQNSNGGGFYGSSSYSMLANSVVWGNKKGYYVNNVYGSCKYGHNAVEGGITDSLLVINVESSNDGIDMSKFYVRFNDPQHGDYTLHVTSPCINYGDSLMSYYLPATDLAGNPRMVGVVDLGAYETDVNTSCPSVVGVAANNVTSSTATVSWKPMGEESSWSVRVLQDESDLDSTFTATDTVVVFDGLLLNRTYTVYVRALCDSGGVSLYSIPVNFTTDCDESLLTPLDEFASMMPENNTQFYTQALDFAWTSMPMATSYDFYFWKAGDSEPTTPTLRGLTTAGVSGYNVPSFANNHGSYFYWKVVAWNECISRTSDVMTLQEAPLPNLHVSGFTVPDRVAANQTITVEWTVVNDGQGSTPPGATWNDYIWVTGHNGVGGGFLYDVDEQLLATVPNLQSLAPGESYTNSVNVQLPQDYIGGYYFFVFADQYSANNINYAPTGDTVMALPYTPSNTGSPYPYLQSQNTSYPSWYVHSQMEETVETDNFFYIQKTILPPPTPNLHVTNVGHPLNAYSSDTITILWQVTNEGDAAALGSWSDAVYLSEEEELDYSTAILMGTSYHDGTLNMESNYSDSIRAVLPLQLGGTYHVFVSTDIQNSVYESIYEADNVEESAQTINVIMSPPADLEVMTITMDTDLVSAKATYTVTYEVINVGARAISNGHWRDLAYLSADPQFNLQNACRIGSRYIYGRSLGIDESYTETMTITIPDSINDARYLYIMTDADDDVFEYTNEDNNVLRKATPLQISLPDLQTVWVSTLQEVVANQPITLVWRVQNVGQGRLNGRRVNSGLTFYGQTLVQHNEYLTLDAGEYVEYTDTLTLPCRNADAVTVYAKADMNYSVYETNENNSTGYDLTVLSPDLSASNLTILDTLWSGTTATASWTLTNSGQADVDAVVTDRFYLGNANSYNAADSMCYVTRQVTLAAGQSIVETFDIAIPNGVQGQYYVHQIVNADGDVCEGVNEASNRAVSGMSEIMLSPYPDLVVSDIDVPSSLNIGESFTINYAVSNQGTGNLVNKAVVTRFYASRYTTFSLNTATLIGDDNARMTIATGDEANYSAPVRIPTTVTSGLYYIYAVVDATDNVYEYVYENNNTTHSQQIMVNVYPLDLAVYAVETSDVLDWGGTYTVDVQVKNLSQVPTLANYWSDQVFLSQDDVLQTSDVRLSNVVRQTVVPGDSSYTVSFMFKMPYGYTSPAYLIALADANGNNPDINSANNILVQPVAVNSVPTADLAVTSVALLDEQVFSGQDARIAYTITNVSEQAIENASWTDKVFLSSNNIYEASDVEVGTTTKRGMTLAPNATYTDTALFRVPLPQNGKVYLIVRANSGNSFYESNTDNNISAQECVVTLPQPGDLIVSDIAMDGNVISGDTLQVSWSVKNIGSNTLSGNGLRSLVYLSSNMVFDANDRLLGSVGSNYINIIPGDDIEQHLSARVSGLPEGEYYVIVKTDVSNVFNEVNDDNNTTCSAYPFTLTVRNLPFNTPVNDVLYNNLVNDYKLNVDTNTDETVRIHLQSADETSGAVNMLYVTHNTIGSSLGYDFASVDQLTHNPELYIPATEAGYYGVNLQGATPTAASQQVVIRADILPFELREVSPKQGGNTGRVTLMLTGSRFTPDMEVSLTNAAGATIRPATFTYDSYYKAYATFDLTGQAVGLYDVHVVKSGEDTASLHDGFRIVTGTPENLYTNLIFPQSPRPNRVVVAMLEYGNTGNTDIVDPVVTISSIANTPISLTTSGLSDNNTLLNIPLQVSDDMVGVIRPGVSGYVNVYVNTTDNLTFSVSRDEVAETVQPTAPAVRYTEITAVARQAEGCVVGNDGIATVEFPIELSASDYRFRWTTVSGVLVDTNRTATGLASGGYRVRVMEAADTNVNVYEDYVYIDKIDTCERLRVSISSICHTDVCSTPSVESYATATGGTAPYTYSWPNRLYTVTGSGRYSIVCRVVDAEGRVAYGTKELYLKGLECSQDPNEIKGPEGYNEDVRYVAATEKMNYTIGFENDPDFATAPATRVSIVYPIPDGQNIASVRLSDFGFGDHVFSVPANSTTYSKRLDVSSDLGIWVDVTAGIDYQNNRVTWIFQSIDPATGFEPASSQMGFLPVNDSLGRGEGYVSFLIEPKTGRTTGDTVVVDATIVFDDNAPIATNKWKNTFDAVAPTSTLQASLSPTDSNYCFFSFSATDDNGGSGVDHVELYVSQNEGNYEYFTSVPADSSLRFTLVDGILYRFASVAVDHVGNREELKAVPDTVINNNTAPTDILLTASSFRENAQPATVIGRLTTIDNDITLPFSYELVEGDGDADNGMFAIADGRLVTTSLYNCDGRSQYAVRVRTTDITGLSFEKSFVLNKIQENFSVSTTLSGVICAGDSYTFGSRTLTVQDTYVDSLHTVMGCDSVVSLSLRVNPVYHLTDNQVVCDSLTWQDGITYTASTSTPTHELLTAAGCDSVITLNLIVNRSNTGSVTMTACDEFEWHGTTYTASAEPTYLMTNAAGCDSTVTLTLTVNHSNSASETVTACDSYEWHGTTYTASAEPTHITTNAAGCDSTTTLHLTVNHSTTGDTVATACDFFAWQGLTYTVSTDTAIRHTTNAAGCDSTTTLHLTVNYSNAGDTSVTACDSYEWHGTTYTASTETPTFTTTNAAGCDSTATLHLTLHYSSTGDTAAVACDEFEWRGTLYTTSGTPTYTTTNAAGCDSTITLSLTINYSTDVTLEETATNSFVWHGDTLTESGTYTYNGITEAGCDSTVTLVLTIEYVGIDDVAGTNVRLYPNPTRGIVTIEADAVVEVEVYDLVGRKVAVYENTNRVDFTMFEAGTYTLRIRHAGGTTLKRVVSMR